MSLFTNTDKAMPRLPSAPHPPGLSPDTGFNWHISRGNVLLVTGYMVQVAEVFNPNPKLFFSETLKMLLQNNICSDKSHFDT